MPTPRAPFTHLLGRFAELELRRIGDSGGFLAEVDSEPNAPTLLLLGRELADDAKEGDRLEVFVYQDSEGRPLATTASPKLALGEVAFLRVTARTPFGSFVDWGLPKELLVPLGEQTADLYIGARQPIGVYLDDTGRLTGTMRISEMLTTRSSGFEQDAWVEGEAWRNDPEIGLFVILERAIVGLLPREEPHTLRRGDAASFRITNILPDGKLELSLRAHAHEQLADDAQHVLELLQRPGAPQVGDQSSPDDLRELFGLSKKAFKRAVGRLLKEGAVEITARGHVRPLAAKTSDASSTKRSDR
ncbi:MAG TPA: S1-like domain-containing RNA-binding protein [Polyangiaceae bacterium]|nr:S1-like domain-containing RNA-binding protein [Polyangiaceae bacterium]